MRRVAFLAAVATVVFLAGAMLGHRWPRQSERATVASALSPTGSLTALVFRTSERRFLFGLRGQDGPGEVILLQE